LPHFVHDAIVRVFNLSEPPLISAYTDALASSTQLQVSDIDGILLDRLLVASKDASITNAQYLYKSWQRGEQELAKVRAGNTEQVAALNEMQALVVSYCGISMLSPAEYYSAPAPADNSSAQWVPKLLLPLDDANGLSSKFFDAFVRRFEADEADLDVLFHPIFTGLMAEALKHSILSRFDPVASAFRTLLEHSSGSLMKSAARHLYFNPAQANGRTLERASVFGVLLRLSPIGEHSKDVAQQCFAMPLQAPQQQLADAMTSIRASLHMLRQLLNKSFLSARKNARPQFCAFVAAFLQQNAKHTQEYLQPMQAMIMASEGAMLNLAAVMMHLCEPFIDPHGIGKKEPPVQVIDPMFTMATHHWDIHEETKVAVSSGELDKWVDRANHARVQGFLQKREHEGDEYVLTEAETRDLASAVKDKSFNLMTELFFLAARSFHLGYICSVKKFMKLNQQLGRIRQKKQEMEAVALANPQQGPALAQQQHAIKQLDAQYEQGVQMKLAYDVMLLDPAFLQNGLRFVNLIAAYILYLADPQRVGLPLAMRCPATFAVLPEFLFECVTEFLSFLLRANPHAWDSASFNTTDLITFLITFVDAPTYVRNPYVRGKLVQVIYLMNEAKNMRGEAKFPELLTMPIAKAQLAPSFMHYFVDCEFTGSHTQFYDKFEPREQIGSMLKELWTIPAHRQAIENETRNHARFIRFVNGLLNDAIHLLTDSLQELQDVRKYEKEMDDKASWAALSAEDKEQKVQHLEQLKSGITWKMRLGNHTLQMLHFLSSGIVKPFMLPELVDRVAAMLNDFLSKIVGPKCTEVKVRNAAELHFDARQLLVWLTEIYVHFSEEPAFCKAVASDGKSYSPALFEAALSTLKRLQVAKADTILRFEKLMDAVKQAGQETLQEEEELGEVPDEFQDPLVSTLMRDPVILPSGTICDRPVIMRHLLSDSSDPFNRAYCAPDLLKPATELKERIEAWILEKKAARK
jgi:ubiquitin conjugation factor E4 B